MEFKKENKCPAHLVRPDEKDWTIRTWTDSWVTKSGANSIQANLDGLDANGKGTIKVTQFHPVNGDKQFQEQIIQIKLFGAVVDGKLQEHEQTFHLRQADSTDIESTAPFKPKAALLNSGNLGYARVFLDADSIQFFVTNLQKI